MKSYSSASIRKTRQDTRCALLAIDTQSSILQIAAERPVCTYTPYGLCKSGSGPVAVLAYTGALIDPVTEHYTFGNGRRIYSPTLMRFINADPMSPFNIGGLNSYAYCLADPINHIDPSGYFSIRSAIRKFFNWITGKSQATKNPGPLADLKPDDYEAEVAQTSSYLDKRTNSGDRMLTIATGEAAVRATKNSSWEHKFAYTMSGELVIGSYDQSYIFPTHASIAAVAAERLGTNTQVMAAGYIWRNGTSISLSNWSGHYKPKLKRLDPVKSHLENMGYTVQTIRYNSPDNPYNH
nr:RHS repeat-associated core domain-containing protein [Pseudomonas peradeniyensis]